MDPAASPPAPAPPGGSGASNRALPATTASKVLVAVLLTAGIGFVSLGIAALGAVWLVAAAAVPGGSGGLRVVLLAAALGFLALGIAAFGVTFLVAYPAVLPQTSEAAPTETRGPTPPAQVSPGLLRVPSAWVSAERWRALGMAAARLRLSPRLPGVFSRPPPADASAFSLPWTLFALGLAVYAVTRLWALDQYPIYFFTDEATQTLLAEELLHRGLHDHLGRLLPIYFELAGQRWAPRFSVYPYMLTVLLFGKSIFVTRATSAVVSLLAAAAVGLMLKLIFRARYWWAGVLLIAIIPGWFLHSRTAFDPVMMTAFYSLFLLSYLLYRCYSPRYLFAAVLSGAATFYSYSNGQLVIAAAVLLLLVSDLRYHVQQWRVVALGLLLALVVAFPLIRFRLDRPESMGEHLRVVDSYWFYTIPLQEKIRRYGEKYLYALSPQYWFFPNDHDLPRHRMKPYGQIRIELLPLILLGLAVCLRHIRSSPHRAILLAAIATPAGAALLDIGVTRVLAFVVPAAVLAGLGLELLLQRVLRRLSYAVLAPVTFAALSLVSVLMLRRALTEGPLWFRDYGLYGMQYGAKQLFQDIIPTYLARDPTLEMHVSPTWANGTHNFVRFFLSPEDQGRVRMFNVDYYLSKKREIAPNTLLIMTRAEYMRAKTSPKFKSVEVERTVPYPDGSPGFYIGRLAYVDNVDAVFAEEQEARRRLVTGRATIGGQTVEVRHSRLDAGSLKDIFDGDRHTLARGEEANPAIFELIFPQPRRLTGFAGDFGSMDLTLRVKLYAAGAQEPITYERTYRKLPPDPHIELPFDRGPHTVQRLRVEVKNILIPGDVAKIHVRELTPQFAE